MFSLVGLIGFLGPLLNVSCLIRVSCLKVFLWLCLLCCLSAIGLVSLITNWLGGYVFSFALFRVWSLCQGQTMSLGAKGWMGWLLGLLNTTSKVLDLPSGKSFFLCSFVKVSS